MKTLRVVPVVLLSFTLALLGATVGCERDESAPPTQAPEQAEEQPQWPEPQPQEPERDNQQQEDQQTGW